MITVGNEKVVVKAKTVFTHKENLGSIGTLIVTKRLQQIIDRLHSKIGATEWSGILFYKLTKGNINDLKNLEFTADFLYPMNIGSSVYTEFDYNADVIEAYDTYPEGIEMSTALIHSHHSMNAFFSGTDSSELEENAAHYNYYISLIVNFAHEYCAKVAFPSKGVVTSVSEYSIKDNNGHLFKKKSKNTKEEDIILIGDLKIIIQDDTIQEEWLENRIKILEDKKKSTFVNTMPQYSGGMYGGQNTAGFSRGFNSGRVYDDNDWFDELGNYIPAKNTQNFNKSQAKSEQETLNTSKTTINHNSQKFLNAIIWQDEKHPLNIKEGLRTLNALQPDELDIFEQILDQNIQIVHQNIYNTDSEIAFKRHCLEALLELSDYEVGFGEKEGYEIIYTTLGSFI